MPLKKAASLMISLASLVVCVLACASLYSYYQGEEPWIDWKYLFGVYLFLLLLNTLWKRL